MPTTKQAAGAGFRHCQLYEIDANGFGVVPATGAVGYDGLWFSLAKALTITIPDPQILQHTGDDRVGGVDLLPPTEAMSAELRTGKTNLEVDALLSNINVVALGEMQATGAGTDQQGMEPHVCILAYRQAIDIDPASATKGARRWIWVLMSQAIVFPKMGAMEEQAVDENTYTVQPMVFSQYPWGIEFGAATEGYEEAQLIRGIAQHRPHLAFWEGDAAVVAFTFATTKQAAATTRVKVFHYVALTGVTTDVTATVVVTTADITFTVAPAADDIVTAFYEMAD